jgi:NAD(P)-dependent dehydrogenase (short-subunit alcohol dehydrogenase family)
MAEAVLAAGGRVVITGARSVDELKSVEKSVTQRFGSGRIAAVRADVSRPEQCRAAVDRTLEAFGGLHVLVNNAGRGMREISETFNTIAPRFWEVDLQAWSRIVDSNLNGAFYMAHAAAPTMLAQGFGRIINVSTSLATMQRKGYSPYGPSKAALEAMTSIWAQDLSGTGVTVNSLLPGGAADTDLLPGLPGQRSYL